MKYLCATITRVNINMNLHNIDGVTIPFDKTWRSIAISLSGGADSALLAYLLCSFIPNNSQCIVHVISHTRMWKTRPWQGWDSQRVYNWLTERFT
jgi:predicted phosphoadenosine phosphosulfate sulfurtransferase